MNNFNFAGQIYNLETRQTKAGKPFCTFNLVAEEVYKNESRPIVIKMTAFNQASDTIMSFGEGADVIVSGKLDSREYQGKHYPDFKIFEVKSYGTNQKA